MIAGWCRWAEGAPAAPRKPLVEALLTPSSKTPPTSAESLHGLLLAGERETVGRYGPVIAALTGWIDNATELAAELGVSGETDAGIYAAAVSRWGVEADRRIIGNYAAIVLLPDGDMQLSRSPWDAPPLYYHLSATHTVASPLLRALFASGVERRLDYERIVDELARDWRSGDEQGWYHGVLMTPLGAAVRISGQRREVHRWHRPPAPIGRYDEKQAVEQACALLDESAAKALSWAKRPALALSGGLDSPLVGSALLKALPSGERLTALTFTPDHGWDGREQAGTMGDETPLVREFVSANPRIDWHSVTGDAGAFDRSAREIYAVSGVFSPGLANVGMYHGIYGKARELGRDSLLTADFGNSTISDAGYPAYCEYARSGRWGQLVRLLRNRPGDPRSLGRKLIALSILPQVPARLRTIARNVAHPARSDMVALLSPLSPVALRQQRQRAAARGSRAAWQDYTLDRSRAETVLREWIDADGPGKDVDLAFEQVYGVRKRDVTAYRPLVDFCLSLPTEAFAFDGVHRRLARLMGRGRVPEAIRTNQRHGYHNIDWHARIGRDRAAMRSALETARGHPWLGETLDIDRLLHLLDNWPETSGFSVEEDWPRMLALPRALLAARFIGVVEGRNDL